MASRSCRSRLGWRMRSRRRSRLSRWGCRCVRGGARHGRRCRRRGCDRSRRRADDDRGDAGLRRGAEVVGADLDRAGIKAGSARRTRLERNGELAGRVGIGFVQRLHAAVLRVLAAVGLHPVPAAPDAAGVGQFVRRHADQLGPGAPVIFEGATHVVGAVGLGDGRIAPVELLAQQVAGLAQKDRDVGPAVGGQDLHLGHIAVDGHVAAHGLPRWMLRSGG